MPCFDPGADEDNRLELTRLRRLEATLCGVFRAMSLYSELTLLLERVDWKEVGVQRRDIEEWWAAHQAEDAARRTAEKERRRVARVRANALSKLTDEERAALNIHLTNEEGDH